jgi:ATP phosphoribosyltransferase
LTVKLKQKGKKGMESLADIERECLHRGGVMARLKLKFGFPLGSLEDRTTVIVKKIGMPVDFSDRKFKVNVEETDLFSSVIFMRPLTMPDSIKEGTIDCGICGLDCVEDAGLKDFLEEVTPLNYSKKTNNEVDVILFSMVGFEIKSFKGKAIRVASEFKGLTERFLKKIYSKREFTIKSIDQSAESVVIAGNAELGVCVKETGDTLKENKLKVVKKILTSHTGLWCRKEDMKKEDFRETIQIFGEMLAGALKAEKNEMLKMNVSSENKEQIVQFLTTNGAKEALSETESPTINELADGGYAVEVIVQTKNKFDFMLNLRRLGATKIIELPLNVIMY